MNDARTKECYGHGGAHDTRKSCGDRQHHRRVNLLPTDFAIRDGGGSRRELDFRYSRAALSTGCFNSVCRLWVLSRTASEEMPRADQRDEFGSVMGIGGFRVHLGLLSTVDGERGGWPAGKVIR